MKYLRQIDLDQLKLKAGHDEVVKISREDFESLIEGYDVYWHQKSGDLVNSDSVGIDDPRAR